MEHERGVGGSPSWFRANSRANSWLILFITINICLNVKRIVGNYHRRLNHFILYYEPVVYEGIPLAQLEKDEADIFSFRFHAFGRSFDLVLTVGSSVLSPTALIEIHDENTTTHVPASDVRRCLVEGRLVDDPKSFVHGDIHTGFFDGIITVPEEQYYVEPSTTYFKERMPFKSVIFRRSDVNFTAVRCSIDGNCNPYRMDDVTGPIQDSENLKSHNQNLIHKRSDSNQKRSERIKRQEWENTVCHLKIVADHTFFQLTTDHTVEKALAEMVTLIQEVNNTFYTSDFDYDMNPDRITLMVQGVTVWKSQSDANYKLYEFGITANDFLTLLSEYDFSAYCIAVVFTHREFPNNVLGLAYTGSPEPNIAGGICQKRIRHRSYNIAMTSSVGRTGRLPRAMKIITLAHELGHSFGSSHDPETDECSPSDNAGGVFLMSPYAGSGELRNHVLFSPCSKRSIMNVISAKGYCLLPLSKTGNAICGNGIKEENEECDCGNEAQCGDIDPCCTPSGSIGDPECTIRRSVGYTCSYRQGPCCTSNCLLVPAELDMMCNEDTDCTEPTMCSGDSEYCPEITPVIDGRECHQGLGVCLEGVCKTTVCSRNEMDDCECPTLSLACHICCKLGEICEPAADLGLFTEQSPLLKVDNELCDQGRGYCLNGMCKLKGERVKRETHPKTRNETSPARKVLGKHKAPTNWKRVAEWLALCVIFLIVIVIVCIFIVVTGYAAGFVHL